MLRWSLLLPLIFKMQIQCIGVCVYTSMCVSVCVPMRENVLLCSSREEVESAQATGII